MWSTHSIRSAVRQSHSAKARPVRWACLALARHDGLCAIEVLCRRRGGRGATSQRGCKKYPVCTENLIQVADVMESPKLAE
jgi:hypothetical protein